MKSHLYNVTYRAPNGKDHKGKVNSIDDAKDRAKAKGWIIKNLALNLDRVGVK